MSVVTQRKETGTTVDFMQGTELPNLQIYTYRDDVIGLLGYQRAPATVDAATRDAFFNGALADITNQTWNQGMQTDYAVISWNETAQGSNYYITDCRIGVVIKVTRDFNTGPAYLIDALKAVPWVNAMLTKLSMFATSWKCWKLLTQKRPEPYNKWTDESVSQSIGVSAPIGTELSPLPDTATVKATVLAQGNFQKALGDFTVLMLDKGYAVTYPTQAYGIDICYEKSPDRQIPNNPYAWGYTYKVHVRFWWEFTTVPEIASVEEQQLFVWTATIIAAIILSIGAVIIISVGVYNLTHTRSEWEKWGYVLNPNTGVWEWKVTEAGSKEGPPDFWGYVLPIMALIGAGAAVYFLLPLRPKRREEYE